ncbi:hypothetical protein CMUS01_06076 [Colletotrichum musicola]|uniref:Uncharacterized protein n=1 Tax=Colletotrichum musicola TaxID=2175873 RepID=A0A8H6KN99_9PEZI|nr:hypothetical protein CMUS01_06076 [Colletotrichum musicola]
MGEEEVSRQAGFAGPFPFEGWRKGEEEEKMRVGEQAVLLVRGSSVTEKASYLGSVQLYTITGSNRMIDLDLDSTDEGRRIASLVRGGRNAGAGCGNLEIRMGIQYQPKQYPYRMAGTRLPGSSALARPSFPRDSGGKKQAAFGTGKTRRVGGGGCGCTKETRASHRESAVPPGDGATLWAGQYTGRPSKDLWVPVPGSRRAARYVDLDLV